MNLRGLTIRWVEVIFVAFLLLGFRAAAAQPTDCASGPFIALNLADRDGETANKAVAFPKDPEEYVVASALRERLEEYAKPEPSNSNDASLFERFSSALAKGNTRWITRKGDRIAIYVIYDTSKQNPPELKVTEEARKTRLAIDFETLVKLARKIGGIEAQIAETAPANTSDFAVLKQCRTLTKVRASLEVTATAKPTGNAEDRSARTEKSGDDNISRGRDASARTPGTRSVRSGNSEDDPILTSAEATITTTTGPTEHAFLSADLAVNNVKELKVESGELVEKDNPSTFYVGFDYMVGDVLAERNTPLQGLTFKALVQASRKPLDSLGIALGMRLKSINALGFQLDTLSPWVGYIWNRNDTMTGTKTGHEYKGDWRVGISLNLDKALGWVQ